MLLIAFLPRTTRELLSGKRHLDCESRQPRKGNIKKKKEENIYPAADMNMKREFYKKKKRKHVCECSF